MYPLPALSAFLTSSLLLRSRAGRLSLVLPLLLPHPVLLRPRILLLFLLLLPQAPLLVLTILLLLGQQPLLMFLLPALLLPLRLRLVRRLSRLLLLLSHDPTRLSSWPMTTW